MLSMRLWQHERSLVDLGDGSTSVHDRVTFTPRLPVPGLAGLLATVLSTFFAHRHRRLQRHFAP